MEMRISDDALMILTAKEVYTSPRIARYIGEICQTFLCMTATSRIAHRGLSYLIP
jgi:hypothetical protein